MKAVPSRSQSGNLRLDGNLVALLRKGHRAGRGVTLGRLEPRGGGLSTRWQRGANGDCTDRRDEHQTLHGTSWRTTRNDIGTVKPPKDCIISEHPRLAKPASKIRAQ